LSASTTGVNRLTVADTVITSTVPVALPVNAASALHATTLQQMQAADALKADLASPTFTGDPKAPTPTAGDSDTSIATTAFVTGAIATHAALPVTAVASVADSAPGSPVAGQLWFDSNHGGLFIYFDSFWIQLGSIR
jgi:hypothetical protein